MVPLVICEDVIHGGFWPSKLSISYNSEVSEINASSRNDNILNLQ